MRSRSIYWVTPFSKTVDDSAFRFLLFHLFPSNIPIGRERRSQSIWRRWNFDINRAHGRKVDHLGRCSLCKIRRKNRRIGRGQCLRRRRLNEKKHGGSHWPLAVDVAHGEYVTTYNDDDDDMTEIPPPLLLENDEINRFVGDTTGLTIISTTMMETVTADIDQNDDGSHEEHVK